MRAAILGANGYGGAELIRRLRRHPAIDGVAYGSRSFAGRPVEAAWPHLAGVVDASFVEPDAALDDADVVFLATPHGATAGWVEAARRRGATVVDLSADSRLDRDTYAAWYGPHPHPERLDEARYGLVEAHRHELPGAALIAAPGCNATAVSLALMPLAADRAWEAAMPVCTVIAGVSGAGRSIAQGLHFSEMDGAARAYKVAGTHRHLAEIESTLGRAVVQGKRHVTHAPAPPVPVSFTPHLVPFVRGIVATCTVVPDRRTYTDAEVFDAMHTFYADDPVVHVQREIPDVKSVAGSDRAIVSSRVDERTGAISTFVVIDNLGKGAAGQAVQGFNVAFGIEETTALEMEGRWP